VELVVNLTANWFWPFFTDGWSLFDFIVVLVGLISQISLLSHIRATLFHMRTFDFIVVLFRLGARRADLSCIYIHRKS
jgi:hypothetical protein